MNSQAEDKLLRMLTEGKITPEQFKELRATAVQAEREVSAMRGGVDGLIDRLDRIIPAAVRVQIAGWSMAVFSTLRMFNIMNDRKTIFTSGIIASAIAVVLGIALANRKRWGYVYLLTMLCIAAPILLFTYMVKIHFGWIDAFIWAHLALMISIHREFGVDLSLLKQPSPGKLWASMKRAWSRAPRSVQWLLVYLVVIVPLLNLVRFSLQDTMMEMARQQGKTLGEIRLFILPGMRTEEAVAAMVFCFGLALGLLYRQKWAWAIGVMVCAASLGRVGYDMIHDVKESFIFGITSAMTGDMVRLAIDAAVAALLALSFRWYFPKTETEQLVPPDGEPV
ncbi:hypothetical protein LLG95_18405 [bacterium]|nr:hypothetical protein [bacterium]